VIHAHFYQPPRENPWTEEVPREPSAGGPFHDWNERISAESYRPNAYARIFDGEGRVLSIVNNYEELSFNVGPTLMSWLERHQPDVYDRIREAETGARGPGGVPREGGAIAQAWNHMILPLADERDVRTQIRWGLADFRHRFGREAPGMWLPETAVNPFVLQVLAEEGVGFTILAPSQVAATRPLAGRVSRSLAAVPNKAWTAVDGGHPIDTRVAYRYLHPRRRGLGVDLVVYHGGLSHALAFESVTSETLVDRASAAAGRRGGLVAIALDGETFGHHHKWADRALAYALTAEAPRRGLDVTNLASWLERNPPLYEAQVHESAWSCAHGVGRWSADCGCSTGGPEGADQKWRAPLRAALDGLRATGVEVFERRGPALFAARDPWAARDAYVDVLVGATSREEFAARWLAPGADAVLAFTLLEAQRNAMLMYTSCGWFFYDLAGLETVQVLRYAARVCDLLVEAGEPSPEPALLDALREARSFDQGDGRRIWAAQVAPARVDANRVAAHLALADLFGLPEPDGGRLGGFDVETLNRGHAAHPAALDPGWQPPAARRTALRPEPDTAGPAPSESGGAAARLGTGAPGRPTPGGAVARQDAGSPAALAWRHLRLTQRRTGRVKAVVAVALQLGDREAVGAVRAADWPGDADPLEGLRLDIESGRSDDELVTRLADRFVTTGAGEAFDVSSLLPEAAEALLDRAAAGLADHLAAAAEPFLRAAQWAALANRELAGGSDRSAPEWPFALRGSAEAALAHQAERLLAAGDLDAAVALARRARSLGLAVLSSAAGATVRQSVSDTVLAAVRRAVDSADRAGPGTTTGGTDPARDPVKAARDTLALARELGIDPDLDRAQELVYDTIRSSDRPDLAPLAEGLGLSPALFESKPEDEIRTSA
jgi:alpha-amylase/alpha-mannosidase (GH57 family)